MSNSIQQISRFQTDRNLDKKEYEALNEHTNIVEELLESLGFDIPKENRGLLKLVWTAVIETVKRPDVSKEAKEPTDDDKVDAYCDIIVFSVGALMKLGYDPELSLQECAKEINSRVGSMVNGKFEKDLSEEAKANWYKADYTKCKRK